MGRAVGHLSSEFRFWLAGGLGLLADLLSKWYACKNLVEGQPREVIPGILNWTLWYNPGIAFGIKLGWWLILSAVILGVVLVIWLFLSSEKNAFSYHVGLGLILGGAFGNLVDRLRDPWMVRDFIDFSFWPTFNVADALLCIGVGLVGLWILRGHQGDRPSQDE